MRGSNKFSRALSISILVVLCLYAVFAMMKSENSNINKGKRYKEAIEYMNNGDFATAEDELNALADKKYKDSGILAEYAGLRADNADSEKLAEFKEKLDGENYKGAYAEEMYLYLGE